MSAPNPSIRAAAETIEGGLAEIVVGAISFYQLAERAFAAGANAAPVSHNLCVEAACKAAAKVRSNRLGTHARWPQDYHPEVLANMRKEMSAALLAAFPLPVWHDMKDAPKTRSILLLGLPADEDGVAYDLQEVRQVGFFKEHTGGWWTADLTRFIPRLWAELPAMPADAMTFPQTEADHAA